MNKKTIILAIVLLGIFSRIFTTGFGFSAAFAAILFGGYYLKNIKFGFLIPITALLITDLIIGLNGYPLFLLISVYLCYLFTFLLGSNTLKNQPLSIGLTSIGSSIFFFVITNFVSWIGNTTYTQDFSGLMTSFIAGVPFFRTGAISDLLFSFGFFGLMYTIEKSSFTQTEKVKI